MIVPEAEVASALPPLQLVMLLMPMYPVVFKFVPVAFVKTSVPTCRFPEPVAFVKVIPVEETVVARRVVIVRLVPVALVKVRPVTVEELLLNSEEETTPKEEIWK